MPGSSRRRVGTSSKSRGDGVLVGHAAAVDRGDAGGADGEDLGERVAVDAEALVVVVGLEHEQRGVVGEHAVLDREVEDLLADVGLPAGA
jgi:hypothetical protein